MTEATSIVPLKPTEAGPPLLPPRSTGWQPRIERNRGDPNQTTARTYPHGKGIDMTSRDDGSTPRALTTPDPIRPYVAATTFCFTRQAIRCSMGSIRREKRRDYWENKFLEVPFTRLSAGIPSRSGAPGPGKEPGHQVSGNLTVRITCNTDKQNPLQAICATGTPKASFGINVGGNRRCRARRKRAYRVLRAASHSAPAGE